MFANHSRQIGAGLTEFSLLVALIAIASISSVRIYGAAVNGYFETNTRALDLGETGSSSDGSGSGGGSAGSGGDGRPSKS